MIYVIGLVGVVCLYIVGIYAINRASAEALIKDLMKIAQGLIIGGSNKKDFVNSLVGALLKDTQSPAPLSAITTKVIEKQIDNIIEKNVPEVKEQFEKLDLGDKVMANSSELIQSILVSEEKGIISVYGRLDGSSEDTKKIEYTVGVNYIKKIK